MASRRHIVPRRLSDGLRPPLSRLGPAEPTADHLDAPADHTWPPAQAGAPGESAPPSTVHPHAHCTLLSTRGVDACGVQCGATPRRPPRPDQQCKLRSPRKVLVLLLWPQPPAWTGLRAWPRACRCSSASRRRRGSAHPPTSRLPPRVSRLGLGSCCLSPGHVEALRAAGAAHLLEPRWGRPAAERQRDAQIRHVRVASSASALHRRAVPRLDDSTGAL